MSEDFEASVQVNDSPRPEQSIAPAPRVEEAPKQEPRENREPPPVFKDNKRQNIASKVREIRAKEEEGFHQDHTDETLRVLEDPNLYYGKFSDSSKVTRHQREDHEDQPVRDDEPPRRKFKINGKEVYLTDEEVTARVQKTASADEYLQEASRIRQQAQQDYQRQRELEELRWLRESAQSQSQHQAGQSAPPEQNFAEQQATSLEAFVDAMQVGSREEAMQAAQAYLDSMKQQREPQQQGVDKAQLRRMIQEDQDDAVVRRSFREFAEKDQDLSSDPVFTAAATAELEGVMREDLTNLLRNSQHARQVAARFGLTTPEQFNALPQMDVGRLHRFFRTDGAGAYLLSPEKLKNEAVNRVRVRLGRQQSQVAKQNTQPRAPNGQFQSAPQGRAGRVPMSQPRRASSPSTNNSIQTQQKTASDVIMGMKNRRVGQKTF